MPRLVRPSKKSTVPVGVPAPGGRAATVAVNVTVWRKIAGVGGGGQRGGGAGRVDDLGDRSGTWCLH